VLPSREFFGKLCAALQTILVPRSSLKEQKPKISQSQLMNESTDNNISYRFMLIDRCSGSLADSQSFE